MKTLVKLLAVAVVLGLTVADEVKGEACDIDQAGLSKKRALGMAIDKFDPCFEAAITTEIENKLKDFVKNGKTLEDSRDVVKDICRKVPELVSCIAEVRESLEHCQNKEVILTIQFYTILIEHLLPMTCEDDGYRLGYLAHITTLMKETRYRSLTMCIYKLSYIFEIIFDANIDFASKSYITYKEVRNCKKCLAHLTDEDHKNVVEWLINEVLTSMKCQHPEEDRLVPCGDIDVSKVEVKAFCEMGPLNNTNLYDLLEKGIMHCYSYYVNIDQYQEEHINDLEWLKDYYKGKCNPHKQLTKCIIQRYAFEACLSQEEEKQFQLFAQSMEDFVERSCVEEGARMATVMHEVYQQTPEYGHALRDCYHAGAEARKFHQGHAVSSKNMRFYHEMIAFKQCVVDKLHANNDVSKDVENMINDVLKKMKCVSPEDGTVVHCETIHEH